MGQQRLSLSSLVYNTAGIANSLRLTTTRRERAINTDPYGAHTKKRPLWDSQWCYISRRNTCASIHAQSDNLALLCYRMHIKCFWCYDFRTVIGMAN